MMRALGPPIAVVLALLVAAAAPAAGLVAAPGGTATVEQSSVATATPNGTPPEANATRPGNASTAPGAMLSGVVGVQGAELEGDLEDRAFGLRVARAATNGSKAAVVGDQFATIRDRLDALERERERLDAAYENDSITEDRYRARLATLAARIQATERLANRTESTARGLPAEALRENGVDVAAIEALRANASRMTGPEVAAVARGIAGDASGAGLADTRGPNRTGPPGDVGPAPSLDGDRGPDGNRSAVSTDRGNDSDPGGPGPPGDVPADPDMAE